MTGDAELHYRQGTALHDQGDFAGALAAYDRALRTAPLVAAVHYGRGNALIMLRRPEQAIAAFERCLTLEPGHVAAAYNRATVFAQSQRWHEALTALDDILRQHPTLAEAWNNRSGVLQALGRPEEALQSVQKLLQLRPSDARGIYNAGLLLLVLKRVDEAQAYLARALKLDPKNADAMGNLASAALQACDWETLEGLAPRLFAAVRDASFAVPPLTLLALTDDPQLQKRCAELNTRRSLESIALAGGPSMVTAPYRHDRIRIGYLSSDFRDHPVAAQIVGLLERHDRARFEVIGLSTGRPDAGNLGRRIAAACDRFLDISSSGSREAATLIAAAEVDILVDLNGHTMGWRPAILKYRPAPVIAAYLGYAGTTGAEFVDYIIGDAHVTPFDLAPAMAEKIVQLPACFWPSDPARPQPEPVSRDEAGLPSGAFVFCCFNSHHKIRPATFDIWARLLHAVPGSVLWIRDASPAVNERFRRQAVARGVDATRILFAGRTDSFARHLGRQAQADLFLDTFPYTAHATASDALWAGLPIVTLRGQSMVSRICAGLLANAGLDELIAESAEEYEAIALALARDAGRLAGVRRRLADGRVTAPLFDMDRFVRGIEAAYLEMQARAQRGEAPAAFRMENA